MPSSYRPRPLEVKSCSHCGASFESRHKRTIYCSSSCRTLAYNLRHQFDHDLAIAHKQTKEGLAFSGKNIGVVATGALLPAIANYAFNDLPAQKQLMAKLEKVEREMNDRLNHITAISQCQIDYIRAMLQHYPELQVPFNQARQQRELAEAKHQEKRNRIKALIAKARHR